MNKTSFLNKGISTPVGTLIVLAVALLAGGVVIWQNQQVSDKAGTPEVILNNKMAGWKTYTNARYGFEFKYPESWVVVYDKFDYQTAACQASHATGCVKALQVGLGKSKGKSLLDINMRQCTNVVNFSSGNYICFDSALGDKKGTTFSDTGERLNLLDSEVKNAIDTIKNTFSVK